MAFDRLDDARLAEAWVSGDPANPDQCPSTEMFWNAARGGLPATALHDLLDHTAQCGACALALKTACEIYAESAPNSAPAKASLWKVLGATMLRPEAALTYLLLLAFSFPVYRTLTTSVTAVSTPTSIVTSARVIGLEPESVPRGGETPATAPVTAEAGEALVLRLFIDRDDLAKGEPLNVTVKSAERVLYDRKRAAKELGEGGTLDLLIDTAALPSGQPLVITVTSGATEVFRRSVTVVAKH